MARLLFLTWSGAGNQGPAIGLAQALARRGHSAIFAGEASQRALFEARGFAFRALPPAIPPPGREAYQGPLYNAWTNPLHPGALAKAVGQERPDGLVIDCLMFAALAGAERLGLPMATLLHSTPGALAPPGGPLEASVLEALAPVRETLGLPPLATVQDAWRPFLPLCCSIAELDPPGTSSNLPVQFLGPFFEAEPPWTSPWPRGDDRPLILVSFSTALAWNQTSRIARTVEALADGPFRVHVTTGPHDISAIARPANAVFAAWAPHRQVLKDARVAIVHAGHGTVIAALAAGVPLVCLPNLAADQPALADRIQALGAGLALDGDNATPAQILEAVERVLANPAFAARAAELGQIICAAPGADGTVSSLEQLLAGA